MRALSRLRPLAGLVAFAFLVGARCDGENPGINPFGDPDPVVSLDDAWPDGDGTTWSYRYVSNQWAKFLQVVIYDTPEDIPPLPTLEEVEALLGTHASEPGSPRVFVYTMGFDGIRTTESGAMGKNVVTELTEAPVRGPADRDPPRAFWGQLWVARPDLRETLVARGRAPRPGARGIESPLHPTFLFGYAWIKTEDFIGSYGDLDLNPSWKYLEADLEPGHEFTHQLIPAIADDVYLHARILPRRTVETPAGTFDDVVECLYLVDFGVAEVTDGVGQTIGYGRVIGYGTVAYAPTVGPVASYERLLVSLAVPLPPGLGDIAAGLESVTRPD